MRILASADHHFDQHSRFDECRRVHSWMVDLARERKVDLFVSGGDIYERASTPLERQAVAEWLTATAEVCPVLIAKGNHDRRLDCALLARLRTRHPIIVEEAAAVHRFGEAAIATMAWPERSGLLAAGLSGEAADTSVRDALRAVLRGLGDELAQHQGPRLLLGHFMADGAETSTGQPLLGQPINVSLADFALARAQLVVMGHIHKRQQWEVDGAQVLYTGSPIRTDFGQLEGKSVVVAEFRRDKFVGIDWIDTPATPMVHIDTEFRDGVLCLGDRQLHESDFPQPGAEVRLRYRVASDQREPARAAARETVENLIAAGAVHAKLEEQLVVESRARAPEITAATTLVDKVETLWRAKGFEPGERRKALLGKVTELEAGDAG